MNGEKKLQNSTCGQYLVRAIGCVAEFAKTHVVISFEIPLRIRTNCCRNSANDTRVLSKNDFIVYVFYISSDEDPCKVCVLITSINFFLLATLQILTVSNIIQCMTIIFGRLSEQKNPVRLACRSIISKNANSSNKENIFHQINFISFFKTKYIKILIKRK